MSYTIPLANCEKFTVTDYQGTKYLAERTSTLEDETKTPTENLEKMNVQEQTTSQNNEQPSASQNSEQLSLTQEDLMSTSMNIELSITNDSTEPKSSEIILARMDEIMRQRHHILTLDYTIQNNPNGANRLPKFLHTTLDFHPYYGSNEAKEFFTTKLRSVKTESDKFILNQLSAACKDFTEHCTQQAEQLKLENFNALNNGSEEGRRAISNFTVEVRKLKSIWTEKYRHSVAAMDKAGKETQHTKSATGQLGHRERPRPYYKRPTRGSRY